MNKNNSFKLLLIIFFGLLLRIWYLDKPEGMWNDEYVGWMIAAEKNLWVFFQDMVRNCHTPLYYLYLKIWMFFFSDADLCLRYSSVVPSTLGILTMYFCGKELKNEKLGFLCAFITAISSFSIYFAQEVRLYSLLFLITSLSLLYTIKVLKEPNKKDMIFLFIFSTLIVLIHTLGFIYVFLLLIFITYYIVGQMEEEQRKKFLYNLCVFVLFPLVSIVIIISPFLYNILTYKSLSQFWTGFNIAKVILTFSDYLSPIQSNIINTPDSVLYLINGENGINYIFIIFAVLPTLIGIYAVYNAMKKKNRVVYCLFFLITLFFTYLVLISYTGRMVLITKYSSELYPALILLVSYGLWTIKNKKVRYSVIALYLILNLFYIFVAVDSAPKRTRPEGHLSVVELLRNSRLKQTDYVLLTYYDKDKFDKYLTENDIYKFHSINKFNFNYFLYNDADYRRVINDGKYLYINDFNQFPNQNILKYSQETFIKNMKKGDRIGVITLETVSFMSNEDIQKILENKTQYKNTPYIFLVFSMIKNSMYASFKDGFKIDSITHAGDWTLVVFRKS